MLPLSHDVSRLRATSGCAPSSRFLRADHGRMRASSDGTTLTYFVVVLACDGTVARTERVWVHDDEEALSRAVRLAEGHAFDVWDELRLVDHVTLRRVRSAAPACGKAV